jgi:hypothetical protein
MIALGLVHSQKIPHGYGQAFWARLTVLHTDPYFFTTLLDQQHEPCVNLLSNAIKLTRLKQWL